MDTRERVVAAIRASLPEFAERNGVELSSQVMDNLARWVTGTVPSHVYRDRCPGSYFDPPMACSCPGTCQQWLEVEQSSRRDVEVVRGEGRDVTLTLDGAPFLEAWPGGTGSCWNIAAYVNGEPDEDNMHVCDLDDLIAALAALKDSDAHAENVRRWEWPKQSQPDGQS